MHLNFHYFKFLCPALDRLLKGTVISSCFSQNKDELLIGFHKDESESFIRAHLVPANTCLGFPDNFKRSKKNNVTIFSEIIGFSVETVEVLPFERAFLLKLEKGMTLLFKMHGSRSNILLYKDAEGLPESLFRNELKEDRNIYIKDLIRPLETGWGRFLACEGNALQFLPTLGKVPRNWLKSQGYPQAGLEEKWKLMNSLMDMLDSPLFSIIQQEEQYVFTLLPEENAFFTSADPIAAANEYLRYRVVFQSFEKEKNNLIKNLEEQKKRTIAYIEKNRAKLRQLKEERSPGQTADILMANLYQIPKGALEVRLLDFYSNQEVVISLKKGVSPARYAEELYRKGKNRKIELHQLEQNLGQKELLLEKLGNQIRELEPAQNHRELKSFTKAHHLSGKKRQEQGQVPFKCFEEGGFEILVGKSAKSNDEMLRHYTWKEDLWLHAKDVSGSHVVIKHQSGVTFPKTIIERAAELAAYYSKNKNESLAAVIYTPCKYVRKVKGAAPGAVKVDMESVIMVHPTGPGLV